MDNKAIGCYLLRKRKEVGKTQKELADHFGVTYQAVSRWENGESIPDIETLAMIADFYDVSIDEILQREVKVKKDKEYPEEFDPSALMWLMFIVSVACYVIGYFLHIMFVSFDLETIGYVCYVIFAIGGIIVMNSYFFTFQFYGDVKKRVSDYVWYIGHYIPLVIFSILIL